jgi:hypothetical protein
MLLWRKIVDWLVTAADIAVHQFLQFTSRVRRSFRLIFNISSRELFSPEPSKATINQHAQAGECEVKCRSTFRSLTLVVTQSNRRHVISFLQPPLKMASRLCNFAFGLQRAGDLLGGHGYI